MTRMLAGATLVAVLLAGSAIAGVDIDFGATVPVGDDGALFLSISSRYFGRDRAEVEDWSRRWYPDPDDLAVALFLGRHCDRGPDFAFALRRQGVGWFEISNRCGVPADVFFVPVARDPGPPYGKAYGHWRKHRDDRRHRLVLDDDDIRHLVAARMIHEYYGVPIETAMQWRAERRDLRKVLAERYRERHDRRERALERSQGHERHDARDDRGDRDDKGQGERKDKGKGKNKDKDKGRGN